MYMAQSNFSKFNLSDTLLKSIEMLGFKNPTKVQEKVIPAILAQQDIIVKSQTGSGKTAAFGIPICQLIDWEENKPQALVIVPTRELAIQVKEEVFNIGRFKRLKISAVFGKSPFYNQRREIGQKTHVIVGTPGRLIAHLERGTLDPLNIKYLIIDEADKMLDMGFIDQVETIISYLPKERVTVLLSATMPKDIEILCGKHMKEPLYIETESKSIITKNIIQEQYSVSLEDKMELLRDVIIVENPDSCIVFCNTQEKVDEVFSKLQSFRYPCDRIHGGIDQSQRLAIMNSFKQGYFRYLIATDVAARGIDIENISVVINYDIPDDANSYIHRIGRTGRVGKVGKAITFVTPRDSRYLKEIERSIGEEISKRSRPSSDDISNKLNQFTEKLNTSPIIKKRKSALLNKEITKLHINAGSKIKMRPTDIVGTLCSIEGLKKSDIGVINIVDYSTFVEILNNKGELAFKELQKMTIKGRQRKVSKVDS